MGFNSAFKGLIRSSRIKRLISS